MTTTKKLEHVSKWQDGQTLQCCVCLKMHGEVWADLNGTPFVDYYCWSCIERLSEQSNAAERSR